MKDNNVLQKQFKIVPIGETESSLGCVLLRIYPDYKKALKHLDLFSHAIMFLGVKQEEKHLNEPQNDFIMSENIFFLTVKIVKIELEKRIIEVDDKRIKSGWLLYDIKPYFPCEDRVRHAVLPSTVSINHKWRQEVIHHTIIKSLNHSYNYLEVNNGMSLMVQQVGDIRKIENQSIIELSNEYKCLISEIEGYSHIRVIWWFDKFDKANYRKITECNPPYENAPKTGIFATRSPVRPNPIALTTVKVLNIDTAKGIVNISSIDAFDKTPIIGIVPYIPENDRVKEYSVPKWLKHWPEWMDDEKENKGIGNLEIMDSDINRLKKYLVSDDIGITNDKDFFEEESKIPYKATNDIEIIGARQNNLKNISCTIPKNKLTVITGVSGSGKSSLAFDTIFSESQRRFMDSLSVSGRAFFEQVEKPDIDQLTGLPPAIAIEQKTTGRNPRSTVGTMTDIYDYLKLLFAKIGIRHCPKCKKAVMPLKTDEIVNILSLLVSSTTFRIKPYDHKELSGEFVAYDKDDYKDLYKAIKDSVVSALDIGNGAIEVVIEDSEPILLQTKQICYPCDHMFFHLTTSAFSFNNPESMCPVCKGLGVKLEVDPDLIISSPELSILDGASLWWGNLRKHRQKPNANWMKGEILALAEEMDVDLELPWKKLSESFRNQALYGSDGREVSFCYENNNGRKGEIVRPVEGAYHTITRLFRENSGDTANRIAASFMRESPCKECQGERLSSEGRLVTIDKRRFPETVIMTIEELKDWIIKMPQKLSQEELKIGGQILKELKKRLENLIEVGVAYLTLDRSVPSLSGGELQRLRLATQLGSGITNILYILDEPSVGLHAKDHLKLITIMKKIKDEGNTVIVVEHDAETMLAADHILDIGPGAGEHGGMIVAEGSPEEIINNKNSETGKFLRLIRNNTLLLEGQYKKVSDWIKITGARHNNLKNIEVTFPIGVLTCITGVSGSGKSSLITKTLFPALARMLNKSEDVPGCYDVLTGVEYIDQIISVSQQPIGRTPRSNPATYTGVFDEIRNLYASLEESKEKGYKKNKFSFNSKEGQCEACGGEGRRCVEMHFMPDVWVECSICHGKRFNKEALEIKYKERTIADILDMTIETATDFFIDQNKISRILNTLNDVGLGYLKLGQSALTLSGGEAQRIKLAKELSREDTGKTLYLLDEPTTGLHFSDVQNLLVILSKITKAGNTVLVIEHNMDVIKNADWIIDLGPEGGEGGGYVVAKGTIIQVAKVNESYTGQFLKACSINRNKLLN